MLRVDTIFVVVEGVITLPPLHSKYSTFCCAIEALHFYIFSLRQDLYHVVTGSVLGFPSASLLVLSQLECPVSFFGAASTSAPPYKADPGHFRHCPFWSTFTTRGSVRGWVLYPPHPRGIKYAQYGAYDV